MKDKNYEINGETGECCERNAEPPRAGTLEESSFIPLKTVLGVLFEH